ncbi:outer membrane protein [Rubrivirga marina]|uniref:Outer membrane protein beta-barrel domain-containing protein n=1 Tax=Rubrivirga marina TaxID=1196024 RepID=A0A271J0E7_9BACT|nr:outer membrane beta-barrel protein [Rubrivirga marina]PAP76524.1 hypothetical protein BSZ37_08760 [Rubrivirga marina]
MTRLPLAALLAALALTPAAAQNCTQALDRAQSSYQSGEFDQTIDRLTTCLEADAFSIEERRAAYRLIGLSYIGKDREADAREAVASLLEVAPNYEPDPALDPPPFVRLVSEMRRGRPAPARTGGAVASTRDGFSVSFGAHALGYSDDDDDSFSGGGGALTLSYGVSPTLSVHAQLSGSSATGDAPYDLQLGRAGLGGRYHFGGGRAQLVPFVGAGVEFQTATYSADATSGATGSVDYTGPAGEVEGGVRYFFSPSLAVDAGLSAAFASLSYEAGGQTDTVAATTVFLGAGLTWQP